MGSHNSQGARQKLSLKVEHNFDGTTTASTSRKSVLHLLLGKSEAVGDQRFYIDLPSSQQVDTQRVRVSVSENTSQVYFPADAIVIPEKKLELSMDAKSDATGNSMMGTTSSTP